MNRTESISSAQVLKKTQPEEFDLVILGVARARPSLRGLLLAKESKSQSSSANTSAGHARTSRACRARTSSTARKSHRTFAEVRNSASHTTASRSTWRTCASASASLQPPASEKLLDTVGHHAAQRT